MKNQFIAAALFSLIFGQALADNSAVENKAIATLANSCRLSVSNVVFGAYDPSANAHQQANQLVQILCTKGTAWTFYTDGPDYYLKYGARKVNGVNITARDQYSFMQDANSENFLLYQVLKSDGQWQPDLWQGAFIGAYRGNGTGVTQILSIPYRIIKNQYAPPNNYSATALAHIDF